MNIGILGSGMVGQALATKLVSLGHSVMIGTRDSSKLAEFTQTVPGVAVGSFAATAAHGEIVFNATAGDASLAALEQAGTENLRGKILIDMANPLDFSQGMPPSLSIANTDSLGEQIQRAFPETRVVKTLNTLAAPLMVDPGQLADGNHHIFVSGNDAEAKAQVSAFLQAEFGWKEIIDLGDITTARGTEMLLPVWVRLWGALGTPMFNFKIVR
ncbi:MAG: NAD(P)-binding domain-containing protein [Herpetosiphonaceae bacterium]|nr:NAD(P)-binding domain-containing protein [Herpetosiphonaceae bacterium]